jgi:hypothetical protein
MGQFVVAGPSNTAVVDKQGMYWMAGKVMSKSGFFKLGSSLTTHIDSGRTAVMVSIFGSR